MEDVGYVLCMCYYINIGLYYINKLGFGVF